MKKRLGKDILTVHLQQFTHIIFKGSIKNKKVGILTLIILAQLFITSNIFADELEDILNDVKKDHQHTYSDIDKLDKYKGNKRMIKPLIRIMQKSRYEHNRSWAHFRLRDFDNEEVNNAFIETINHYDVDLRRITLYVVEKRELKHATTNIVNAIRRYDKGQKRALEVLYKFDPQAAEIEAVSILKSQKPSKSSRDLSAKILKEMKSTKAKDALLKKSAGLWPSNEAVLALANHNDPQTEAHLINIVNDYQQDPFIAQFYFWKAYITSFGESSDHFRANAAKSLGIRKSIKAVPYLKKAMLNSNPMYSQTRNAAKNALINIGEYDKFYEIDNSISAHDKYYWSLGGGIDAEEKRVFEEKRFVVAESTIYSFRNYSKSGFNKNSFGLKKRYYFDTPVTYTYLSAGLDILSTFTKDNQENSISPSIELGVNFLFFKLSYTMSMSESYKKFQEIKDINENILTEFNVQWSIYFPPS